MLMHINPLLHFDPEVWERSWQREEERPCKAVSSESFGSEEEKLIYRSASLGGSCE
jgi:hypothetical protein